MNIKYKIYQPKRIFSRYHGFLGYDSYKDIHNGKEININRYNEVYTGKLKFDEEVDVYTVLEQIFKQFNINHPNDFSGHSLSVGDMVCIDKKLYYCDSFGWKELEVFDTQQATCSFEEYCIFEQGNYPKILLQNYGENNGVDKVKDYHDGLVADFKQFCWEEGFIAEQFEEG